MRIVIVVASFLPFLYYAAKDNHFHFHGRKVSVTEHLLHLVIGVALFIVLSQAVIGNSSLMMAGLLLFLLAGALDEYVWHRDIPEVESNLHAKEHLALMIFVVVALVVNWLEDHQWKLPPELLELVSAAADEWMFHVSLSGDEVDRYAKTQVAFLAFLILSTSLDKFESLFVGSNAF